MLQCFHFFFFAHEKLKKPPKKVAQNRPRPLFSTVQPRPQPTVQNWFPILTNFGTRHLFSYLWFTLRICDRTLTACKMAPSPNLPRKRHEFLYFGSVCIVESWFVLVQARRRWIGGPKWSRQSIANRLVEISVRSNFFLGFGRDRNQYLELQNLTERSSAVIRKWMKLLFFFEKWTV